MSWDLRIYVDLDGIEAAGGFALDFLASFGDLVAELTCEERGSGWDLRTTPILATHSLDPRDDNQVFFHELVARLRDADRAASIQIYLDFEYEGKPSWSPAYLALFGTRHSGRGERRCEASIGYYNRMRFIGRDVTRTTGERVDGAFLLRHITRLCERAQPRGLFFEPEQAVCIPFNYHLVFHSSYTGFVDDLREIAHFWLWGGRGFTDDRHDWPPLYTLEDNESMLLAGRSDYAGVVLLDDLHSHFELLEALFGGLDVPEELVYEAAVSAHGIEPMDTTRGLGIVAEPFLRRYCGEYYLDLLNRIRAWLDADPEAADAAARVAMVPRALGLYLRPGERSMPLHRAGAIAAELGLAPTDAGGATGTPGPASAQATSAPAQNAPAIALPDLLVEEGDGYVAVVIAPAHERAGPAAPAAPAAPIVGPGSRVEAVGTTLDRALSAELRGRIVRYDVLVGPDARMPAGYKLALDGPTPGELWVAVDAQAEPPVWQRVEYHGAPVVVGRAKLGPVEE